MNDTTRGAKPSERKPPFQAGDEEQVAARTVESKERDAKRMRGLGKILADPECRAWLWDLMGFCGVWRTSFTGNSETFFREGQRNVGLRLQAEVQQFPEHYITMMKESA